MPKHKCSNVAADFSSSESLSFAGLLCIQEQQSSESQQLYPKPITNGGSKMPTQDMEFEFSCSTAAYVDRSPSNNVSAEKNFSKAQLVTTISSNQNQVPKQISLEDMLAPAQGPRKSPDLNKLNSQCSSQKQISEDKRRTNKKQNARQGFGQKLFSSFATPCRNCRALEPTSSVKQQA